MTVLDQDFLVPDDAFAVRVQVGSMPMTIVGWISDASALPDLLRHVAKAAEENVKEWDDATPSAH